MMQSDLGKLFIGGISWDTDEGRLREYFSSFGEVLEAAIMKDRTTGRARGFGFIVFSDPLVADQVIKEKHSIDGRMVEAKRAVPRDDHTNTMSRNSGSVQSSPGPVRTRKIFVGGLASTVTENDFKLYFEQFGTVTDGVVMYDHNTKRPRGFGFITFDSEDAVDKVLLKTFHELNGKMVEVKRAVPKDLSPSPIRSPLGGFNYGLGRISNLLSGYNQGYSSSTAGGYGVRMDSRFSPITAGRGGFAPFGSGQGMGLNIEAGMTPNFGGNANFNSSISYGRGMNPYYVANSNRFTNSVGFDGENGGNTSFFSSPSRNLWSNGGLNSTNSSGYVGSGSGNIGVNFANSGFNWGSSPISPQGRVTRGNISNQGGNLGYEGADNSYNLVAGGYGRSISTTVAPTSSYAPSNGSYGTTFADMYGNSSVYGDSTWRFADSEVEEAGAFGYGLGSAASEVQIKSSPGYIGGFSASKGQTNREIAS